MRLSLMIQPKEMEAQKENALRGWETLKKTERNQNRKEKLP